MLFIYPNALVIAGLGELQDTSAKRINSSKKGYMKGLHDIMIVNYHNKYSGLHLEFKSPTNNYQISDAQLEMKKLYKSNNYYFKISNDYDIIIK